MEKARPIEQGVLRFSNSSTHAHHAVKEATDAEDVGALGDVRQRSEVEVAPTHRLAVAITNLTLHLGKRPTVIVGRGGI